MSSPSDIDLCIEGTDRVKSEEGEVCVDEVTRRWHATLVEVNPLLDTEEARAQVRVWATELLDLFHRDPCDPTLARELGFKLELMDSFQPRDLEALQVKLAEALSLNGDAEDQEAIDQRVQNLLFALGAGWYVGKAARAKAFDMTSMSRMSHDLKTPINAITGFSRVILKGIDGPITDFQQEDLTSIYEAGRKLLDMISDVFTVRKQDAARILVYTRTFDVAELLADVVRTVHPMAAEEMQRLELHMAPDLGTMTADASKVRWTILGVLRHMMRQGPASLLSISARRVHEDGEWLVLNLAYELSDELLAFRDSTAAGAEQGEKIEDIALVTCARFCEDLGGELTRMPGEAGGAFELRLPVDTIVMGRE